jgi:glucose/arabinose dehydrogenase
MKVFFAFLMLAFTAPALAAPSVLDPNLRVEEVVSGLVLPTTMAFVGPDDILVLQKNNGKVMRVINGVLQTNAVLDLKVANNSEHGLLGIALHPDFGSNGFVYLYYTQSSTAGTIDDSGAVVNVVGKFHWDGSALTAEPGNPILSLPVTPGPNHNGGIILFGPDGKLYVINGDLNRNGKVQNFSNGPDPDNTSGIFRFNEDGTAAAGNPFAAPMDKYYAYGIRNSFGMAFDPQSDKLWDTENGEDTYDEVNLVEPGFNSGWQSIMGPLSRNINGLSDLVSFPGSHYADPKFSWFRTVGPTGIAFLSSTELGAHYENDVFVGDINNGNIYHFIPNESRDGFVLSGALSDVVAEKPSQLASVIFATGFGGVTDLKVGPDGFLYVVSLVDGAIYRIRRALSFGVSSVSDAELGVPYAADLQIGGAHSYTIASIAGSLPTGVNPDAIGLSGTPTTVKKYKFTLQVTDNGTAETVRKLFSIQVFKPLAIVTQLLKSGSVGKNYKTTLKAVGGKAPYAWSLVSGPGWMNLSTTGQLTGVPVAGDYTVDIEVMDALLVTKPITLSLIIDP